jgi:PiT family inorganic phosphate transporter
MGGANDFANSFGTSIGSKAITLRTAVLIAVVATFSGAIFVGGHVTSTIAKGIVDPAMFADSPNGQKELLYGMLASLLAAGIFLQLATTVGLPVSTTHSIVGAVAGFGMVSKGFFSIEWMTVGKIALSWVVSPLCGAILAYILFTIINRLILNARDPMRAARRSLPIFAGTVVGTILLSVIYKGLKNLHLDVPIGTAILYALVLAVIVAIASRWFFARVLDKERDQPLKAVESAFRWLQILTAGYVAFAHGANDVANGIGPVAAIHSIYTHGEITGAGFPTWILALGGAGIVCGLAIFGTRVMKTIGGKITRITPSRGFVAEFAAATTVLVCTLYKMPISTTHTLVGSVIGVGLARGLETLDLRVVRNIFASWLVTLPAAIILSAGIFKIFQWTLM